ncbi:eCIS core domain-containing protein [Hymenobacter chitinivorans]|nr:DUF4157 domain-containing protein [Hymenobacter chitinivorans]
MPTPAFKAATPGPAAAADLLPPSALAAPATTGLGARPAPVAQRKLPTSGPVGVPGPQVGGLQEMANASPKVRQLRALQAQADTYATQTRPLPGTAAPIQQKANRTGLPDELKAGVESLSGHSLDEVRVHYNSSQPAQLQAHAYAQGTDIHLAPGQEQHLPHEAWHVVQQQQGRVQPTRQLPNEVAVNDDAGLEHEADVMGQQALQLSSSWTPEVAPLRPQPAVRQLYSAVVQRRTTGLTTIKTTPEHTGTRQREQARPGGDSETVVQRLATQIRTQAGEKGAPVIRQVVVRGRPSAVYGNSMGDHTTAFIVHVEGLNVNLVGQTIAQGIVFMNGMADHLRALPGYQSLVLHDDNQPIRQRYTEAENSLRANLASASVTPDAQVQMHLLQEAIGAYLEARELIPFSTINVGEKSKGKSGKGHGESGPAGVLSAAEQLVRAKKGGWDKANVVAAIYGLFDFQSAGMAASEVNDGQLARMTGGIDFRTRREGAPVRVEKPLERLTMMWRQHQLSIGQLYPEVFALVKDGLSEDHLIKAMDSSINLDFEYLMADATRFIKQLNAEFHNLSQYFNYGAKGLSSGENIVIARAKKLNAVYANQSGLMRIIAEMHTLNKLAGGRFTNHIFGFEAQVKQYRNLDETLPHFSFDKEGEAMSNTIQDQIKNAEAGRAKAEGYAGPGPVKNLGELGSAITGRPIENFLGQISAPVKSEDKDEETEDTESFAVNSSKTSTLSSAMHSMSIQVMLNGAGRISGMLSAGRPDSPFKGTMGAHSTAWAAHLDRVRAAIRNHTIPDAYAALQGLSDRVMELYNAQKGKPLGNNAQGLIKDTWQRMNQLGGLKPTTADLSSLQQFIEAILSFYNLIPGVSRDRIDTTGKGEGTYRARLLAFETSGTGTKESIDEAIKGMFDGKGRTGVLWENHMRVIAEAYPNSFNLIRSNTPHPNPNTASASAPARQEQEEDADEIQTLSHEQVGEMEQALKVDNSWLLHQNNCLINAVASANGTPLPLPVQTIVAIRAEIGANLGTMLFASPRVLDIIARHLGLPNGVVVVYHRSGYTDETTEVRNGGGNPVYIFHDGVNHFTPLR